MLSTSQEIDGFWRLFRDLVARLYRPLGRRDGIPKAQIVRAEQQLGLQLPRILVEFYELAGKREDLNQAYNHLVLPDNLHLMDNTLIIYEENQGISLHGINIDDVHIDDPPVYRAENTNSLMWELDHNCLSNFLVTAVYWQGVNGGMNYIGIGRITSAVLFHIEAHWPAVNLIGHNWEDIRVFSHGGQVLCVLSGAGEHELHAAARTRKDFLAIEKALSVEWDYCTLDDG